MSEKRTSLVDSIGYTENKASLIDTSYLQLNNYNITPRSMYKLVLLGDESVGKTSIITRFMFDKFKTTHKVTVGVDFIARTMHLSNDRQVRLMLWDTAGQERFRALLPSYIRDSSVAVIVYDVTNRKTFVHTDQWIEDVKVERGQDVLIVLVGNKTDLQMKRQVTYSEGEAKAKEKGYLFVETSAKEGFNVKGLFHKLAQLLPEEEEANHTNTIGGGGGSNNTNETVDLDTYVDLQGNNNNNAQQCAC